MVKRLLTTLAGLAVAACGTQYADPIQGVPPESGDACGDWLTESDCLADAAHGCSFQPNTVGCKTSEPDCAPGVCRSGDPFVRRRERPGLWLHDQPYRFLGTVSWGIGWGRYCTVSTMADQPSALVRVFDDLVDLDIDVLRVWAFQGYAGTSGTDYSSLEHVVDAARRAGVRLIFVLENHYESCTTGPSREDGAWYRSGYAAPYGDYALSFPDYARGVVSHFKNEPTILGWEIMHEAANDDFDALNGFVSVMSSAVKESDPNHLVALGVDNGDRPGTDRSGNPSNYFRLHEHPGVDLLDVHDFFGPDQPLNASMTDIAAIAAALGKPVFAGATAVELDDTLDFAKRAEQIEAKLVAALDAGYVGFLVYDYIPDWTDASWTFDTRPEDPLAQPNGVFVRHAIKNP